MDPVTQKTLQQLGALRKAWTQPGSQSAGVQAYMLDPTLHFVVPIPTPLRSRIPRRSGGFNIQANWKAVTGYNTTRVRGGLAEGKRGASVTSTQVDYFANFKTIGLEDSATWQSRLASANYFDTFDLATRAALASTMLLEEELDLGGNTSVALGTGPTPVGVGATTGGLMTARTVVARVVPLTLDGYLTTTVSATGVVQTSSRSNNDGTSDTINRGCGIKSAPATGVVLTTATSKIDWTWADVVGAVAYAVYTGVAGSERLAQVVTTNAFHQVADEGGSNQLASALAATDYSQDAFVYDGMLTQIMKSGSNGLYKTNDDSTLTANGSAGIKEIDADLRTFYDTQRLSPDAIYCNSQETQNITDKVLAQGATPAFRINIPEGQGQASITAGSLVGSYLCKYGPNGGKELPIITHPNMPPGTLMYVTWQLPYPQNGYASTWQKLCRSDYYAVDWPETSFTKYTGVYFDGVLQGVAPFANGVRKNIRNG